MVRREDEKKGYTIEGIELSDEKRLMAKNRSGIKLSACNLLTEGLPEELQHNFDIICMFHLIEHLSNPILFIKRALLALQEEYS